jgi:hypothetical protein
MTDPIKADLIKSVTLTPTLTSLVKDVLSPSAELIGVELKSYLKQKIDDVKERSQNKNLSAHISAVQASLPEQISRNITYDEQLYLFSDWVDGAQDISEDEPILSDMWQEILRDIVNGKRVTKRLIETMKQIDYRMAKLLLTFGDNKKVTRIKPYSLIRFLLQRSQLSNNELVDAKRLEKLGLLDRSYKSAIFNSAVLFGGYVALDLVGGNPFVNYGFVIFGLILIGIRISNPEFRLTETAHQLLQYASPLDSEVSIAQAQKDLSSENTKKSTKKINLFLSMQMGGISGDEYIQVRRDIMGVVYDLKKEEKHDIYFLNEFIQTSEEFNESSFDVNKYLKKIEECDYFIAVISSKVVSSVYYEAAYAMANGKESFYFVKDEKFMPLVMRKKASSDPRIHIITTVDLQEIEYKISNII